MIPMNKRIYCIVGGTGSFGNEMLKNLLTTDVEEIRILSRDEKKQDDMKDIYKDPRIKYYIGSVQDELLLHRPLLYGCTHVFFAAAMKQVPSCEEYPIEAIKTNVLGLHNVLWTLEGYPLESFVYLSTDKAVEPINTMGMTKALGEKLVQNMAQIERFTRYNITRYGNVMCSRNSVIPKFIDLLAKNKPITIYEGRDRMTRFLMSLQDAVNLVRKAEDLPLPGGKIVFTIPRSAIVEDIAICLKKLLNSSSEIIHDKPRPGEKFHETLVSIDEVSRVSYSNGYLIIDKNNPDALFKQSMFYSNYADTLLSSSEIEDYIMNDPSVATLISKAKRE